MKMNFTEELLWKALFIGLLPTYILYYAPYGINETDGGFISGLAWQVLNGKTLYHDIIYIRPPLPVWLRVLELKMLPADWSVLGERWIFYLKVWIYSWLGASLLAAPGKNRWMLAAFAFVVSVHCYPAMAWHTVDGIFFAVVAAWCFWGHDRGLHWPLLSGFALFAAILCKQSFYPLPVIFGIGIMLDSSLRKRQSGAFLTGFFLAACIFGGYMIQNNLLQGFLNMTGGATGSGEAIAHGIIDYFRITPELAFPSLVWGALILLELRRKLQGGYAARMYALWLAALAASYGFITWLRQDHTVPFAQSRALFWLAGMLILLRIWRERTGLRTRLSAVSLVLLGISWCAALSWGFNLPMLFALPWIWAAIETGKALGDLSGISVRRRRVFELFMFLLLIGVFRLGYDFIYRDGRRSDMTVDMGRIFPKLQGIYSDTATAQRYEELKSLVQKYGEYFTVLPSFPQASFLTGSYPPLPLDWVVNRETNANNELIFNALQDKNPAIFVENQDIEKSRTDPELSVTNWVLQHGKIAEKGVNFSVIKLDSNLRREH